MTINEIKKIVTHEDTRKYRVKLLNGKTKIVRLWSYYGSPCIIGKGRKHYGHYLGSYYNETDEWVSIKEINSGDVDFKKRIIKRAKDAQKMLEASGFWGDIKKEIDDFLNLPDEKIEEFYDILFGLFIVWGADDKVSRKTGIELLQQSYDFWMSCTA